MVQFNLWQNFYLKKKGRLIFDRFWMLLLISSIETTAKFE